ncbi:MAG: ABC transporter ATP-binding protein [Alicyclobacillus sp.]|nr:ABC transporter ATP-binding protein [Alicyclobacillus sp.]
MIFLKDVNKVYSDGGRRIHVLKDVNLSIDPGEFVAIVGPSGSGKSTLLNVLGLLDRPTSGFYLFGGQAVSQLSSGKLATFRNQKIGFVFQSFMLLPRMSVIDNVQLPLLYSRVGRKERRQRARRALERVGMIHQRHKKALKLSGGEKQRVAIARALVNQPDLILADEPTGNLDDATKRDILRIFRRLHDRGRTIVMVTHDMEAARYAQRIFRFQDGRLIPLDPSDLPTLPIDTEEVLEQEAAGLDRDRIPESIAATGITATSEFAQEEGPAR